MTTTTAWAVVDSKGVLILACETQHIVRKRFVELMGFGDWFLHESIGYTCIPVTIKPKNDETNNNA